LMNEVVHTSPTIGSNVEEIVVKNTHFLMWDIGGQDSLRASWNTYYSNTEFIILVVDSTDRERLTISKEELYRMLAHEDLRKAAVLIFANKQDKKGCMSAAEISKSLTLSSIRDHPWHIQSCCALTGEGHVTWEGGSHMTYQVILALDRRPLKADFHAALVLSFCCPVISQSVTGGLAGSVRSPSGRTLIFRITFPVMDWCPVSVPVLCQASGLVELVGYCSFLSQLCWGAVLSIHNTKDSRPCRFRSPFLSSENSGKTKKVAEGHLVVPPLRERADGATLGGQRQRRFQNGRPLVEVTVTKLPQVT
ncbi:ARL5B protein, partial [Polypterus senegalus]